MPRSAAGTLALLAASVILAAVPLHADDTPRMFDWNTLPALPMPLSGHFAGTSGGALIVAGGTNFPVSLFDGGTKEWYDSVYVLPKGEKTWRKVGTLPRSLAYGGSVSTEAGLICIGGGDARRHYCDVFRLTWSEGRVRRTGLPSLPEPVAFGGAALLGEAVYVVGGQDSPAATDATTRVRMLDFSIAGSQWMEIEPIPGPGRILPAVAAQDGALYVFGGASLHPGPDGKAVRTYLADSYCYRPGKGWKRVADLPSPVTAAPSAAYGPSHILVFGGDDGLLVNRVQELKDTHPGFSRRILAYHTITDTWAHLGTLPKGLVTTNAVAWEGSIVIPGGEDRPGHRSAEVLGAKGMKPKGHFFPLDYGVLIAYLLGMVLIGFIISGRENTTDDFFLGGRRVPWWAAGLSIFGTQLSAITFMAIPAKVYATDWVYILGNMCIVLVAPLVVFFYLPFFRRLNVTTAYEYLEKRFNLPVRLFGSASFILLQVGRMGIVLFLPAIALSAVTGISVTTCIIVMGVLATLYTVLGGIEAVIWTDVVQVIVLLGGAIVSLLVVIGKLGWGVGDAFAVAQSADKFHTFNWTWDITTVAVWVVVAGNIFSNLVPYTADQGVIQRYLTTKDERASRKAIWTNAALSIPAALIFFSVGTALWLFYRSHPGLLNPSLSTDAIFPLFIAMELPAGITGLVVAGLFAAAMSTLDSSMNSVATAIVTDFYRRFRPDAPDRRCLNLARWLTVLLGAAGVGTALWMANSGIKSLWDMFITILGLTGGALAGMFILGIFTRRAHGTGTLIGAIGGAFTLYLVQSRTSVHFFLYAAVGIVACVMIGYAASLIIPAKTRDLTGLTIYTIDDKEKP
ncbi:MAG: sodium/solute symporter [Armatimonadetes bacterium]|nr:sodium/solute symporter [Armatimonadota bacterium]